MIEVTCFLSTRCNFAVHVSTHGYLCQYKRRSPGRNCRQLQIKKNMKKHLQMFEFNVCIKPEYVFAHVVVSVCLLIEACLPTFVIPITLLTMLYNERKILNRDVVVSLGHYYYLFIFSFAVIVLLYYCTCCLFCYCCSFTVRIALMFQWCFLFFVFFI